MTMVKRETSSIWTQVREDMDIDDMIYNYDEMSQQFDQVFSDR